MTTLAIYRTRVLNTLKSTNEKFEDVLIDEAVRRVLDEYSQAFPDIHSLSFALSTSGRAQLLEGCSGLLAVLQLILPYDTALLDPAINVREDFYMFFHQGLPYAYFTGQPIPLIGQPLFVRFARRHTLSGLDEAELTSVRPDHESMLVVGAAGAAVTSRAAGTIEQWGGKTGDPNQLMLWGQAQYQKFREFLLTIRADQNQAIFPESFWPLDGKDSMDDW
jgi:hypothetical protein